MKRRLLLDFWAAISELENNDYDFNFSYFLAKNKILLKPDIELLDKSQRPSEEFLEFENKRHILANKYCDKDFPSGKPQIFNNQYVINEKRDEFEKEMEKLRETYQESIEKRMSQLKEYDLLLEEDITFQPVTIQKNKIPKQINSRSLQIFLELNIIEENDTLSKEE